MKYFDKHPVFSYSFYKNTQYNFLDIFRKNTIKIDDYFIYSVILNDQYSFEKYSDVSYDNTEYSWLIPLVNNFISRKELSILEPTSKTSDKKIYYLKELTNPKFGDIIIKDIHYIDGFSISTNPYSIVTGNFNTEFRYITASETTKDSFANNDIIRIFSKDLINMTFVEVAGGDPVGFTFTLMKVDEFDEVILNFRNKEDNIVTSPYLNVSGSGATYMSIGATGEAFIKTLLYSYITDGISHGISYTVETPYSNTVIANKTLTLNTIDRDILNNIDNMMQNSLEDIDKSRNFAITITQFN